jgi:Ca2+-binding EF-hand superfamily protein
MFKKYDSKGKGYIDMADLKDVNKRLKENLDEETLGLLLTRADSDQDGRITF